MKNNASSNLASERASKQERRFESSYTFKYAESIEDDALALFNFNAILAQLAVHLICIL